MNIATIRLAVLLVAVGATTAAPEEPPSRVLPNLPEVHETFEADSLGQQPASWEVVNSVGGRLSYDALWRVVNVGPPHGRVVAATAVHDTTSITYVSHLAYVGDTTHLTNGGIPRDAHYYVETLLHMKADVANWANEHTLQGIVQEYYNLETLIWSRDNGAHWGLRLYANGGEGILGDWGAEGKGITDNTGQSGWDWWGRVGMDIDLESLEVSVFYNGQRVIGPVTVQSIATRALASGRLIRADVRATNNLMDADDFRLYLLPPTAVEPRDWTPVKEQFR